MRLLNQLDAPRRERLADAAAGDGHHPCEADVHEQRRLDVSREWKPEVHAHFVRRAAGAARHRDFLGTRQALVARQTIERVGERSRVEAGHRHRVVAFDAWFGPDLEAERGLRAPRAHGRPQGEELLRGEQQPVASVDGLGHARRAQDRARRDAKLVEPAQLESGDSEKAIHRCNAAVARSASAMARPASDRPAYASLPSFGIQQDGGSRSAGNSILRPCEPFPACELQRTNGKSLEFSGDEGVTPDV